MTTAMRDVEIDTAAVAETAAGQALRRILRTAGRAIVDYALPPRCPGCGIIVGEDRQFCLTCWSSLHFLDGPACAHCSIPLPIALPGGSIACGACLRSEEHTSELQSLMRISYAVICLNKYTSIHNILTNHY